MILNFVLVDSIFLLHNLLCRSLLPHATIGCVPRLQRDGIKLCPLTWHVSTYSSRNSCCWILTWKTAFLCVLRCTLDPSKSWLLHARLIRLPFVSFILNLNLPCSSLPSTGESHHFQNFWHSSRAIIGWFSKHLQSYQSVQNSPKGTRLLYPSCEFLTVKQWG